MGAVQRKTESRMCTCTHPMYTCGWTELRNSDTVGGNDRELAIGRLNEWVTEMHIYRSPMSVCVYV